jgi:enoyl-CoA hydratase
MSAAPPPRRPAARPPTPPLLTTQQGDVRWLRLNRPERRNALNPRLVTAINEAIADASRDPDTRIVVITGQGPSFCAGADLHYLRALADSGDNPGHFLSAVSDCFTRVERCPKPVIAAVHGHMVAGGLELALACDVVVAQAETLIGDGHILNGLLPAAGASLRLPRRVGESLARWLLLSGQLLPAEAFLPSGFVHAVAPAEQFDDLLVEVIERLRRPARFAQVQIKQLLNETRGLPADDALSHELRAFTRHWHTADIAAELAKFANRTNHRREQHECGDLPTGW